MFSAGPLLDDVSEGRHSITDLVAPVMVDRLVAEMADGRGRAHLCFGLGALASWRQALGATRS